MTFLNRKSNPNRSLGEGSVLNDLRKNVTTPSNQLILTCWSYVCLHYQQTLRLGWTRWKLTRSYQIHCVVSNVSSLVMDKQHVRIVILDQVRWRGTWRQKLPKSPKCKNCTGATWPLPSNALSGWRKKNSKMWKLKEELLIQKQRKSLICTVYPNHIYHLMRQL